MLAASWASSPTTRATVARALNFTRLIPCDTCSTSTTTYAATSASDAPSRRLLLRNDTSWIFHRQVYGDGDCHDAVPWNQRDFADHSACSTSRTTARSRRGLTCARYCGRKCEPLAESLSTAYPERAAQRHRSVCVDARRQAASIFTPACASGTRFSKRFVNGRTVLTKSAAMNGLLTNVAVQVRGLDEIRQLRLRGRICHRQLTTADLVEHRSLNAGRR